MAGLRKFIGSAFPDVEILFSQMYISQNNRYYCSRNPHAVEENSYDRIQDTVECKVPLILDQLKWNLRYVYRMCVVSQIWLWESPLIGAEIQANKYFVLHSWLNPTKLRTSVRNAHSVHMWYFKKIPLIGIEVRANKCLGLHVKFPYMLMDHNQT